MLLMIDNYDSFTYNLVQYLGELGQEVVVFRNDEITLDEIAALAPEHIVISPGPCTPNEAGVSVPLIRRFAGEIPILGRVPGTPEHRPGLRRQDRACQRSSCTARSRRSITRTAGVFTGCQEPLDGDALPFAGDRARVSLPDGLEVTAWTDDGEIMGVRHKTLPVEGVQFHPESILTEHGHELLRNFLTQTRH